MRSSRPPLETRALYYAEVFAVAEAQDGRRSFLGPICLGVGSSRLDLPPPISAQEWLVPGFGWAGSRAFQEILGSELLL